MSTAEKIDRTRRETQRVMARTAGSLYFAAVLAAVTAEFILPGTLGVLAAIVLPISCYAAVTLLLYGIFKQVNGSIALVAVFFGLVGLAFEGLRLQPRGINVGMSCHGIYCLLFGYLIFKSTLLPRLLGISMALAGVIWLIYLFPTFAKSLSPYNSAVGLLAEALPMLWLLALGVNTQGWEHQASAAEA